MIQQDALDSARFRAALIHVGNRLADGEAPGDVVGYIQAITANPPSEAYREYVRCMKVYTAVMETPARYLSDSVLDACMWVAADVARDIPGVTIEWNSEVAT